MSSECTDHLSDESSTNAAQLHELLTTFFDNNFNNENRKGRGYAWNRSKIRDVSERISSHTAGEYVEFPVYEKGRLMSRVAPARVIDGWQIKQYQNAQLLAGANIQFL